MNIELDSNQFSAQVYVPEGENPIARVFWRYQWLWLYAFVHPQSGQTYWWILPYVNIELFNAVLADFATEFGIGKHFPIAIGTRAGRITSKPKSGYSRRDSSVAFTIAFS